MNIPIQGYTLPYIFMALYMVTTPTFLPGAISVLALTPKIDYTKEMVISTQAGTEFSGRLLWL